MHNPATDSSLFPRLTLAFASLSLIGTTNAVLYLFGYDGYGLIFLETSLVVISSALLLLALTADSNKLPTISGSLVIFLTFDIGFQVGIQTMTSVSVSQILPRIAFIAFLFFLSILLGPRLRVSSSLNSTRTADYAVYISFIALAVYLAYYAYFLFHSYSDEFTIDYFSAMLFSHGLNPYLNSLTANVFSVLHIPESALTPDMIGGFVTNLSYPSLSFLIFIPSVILRVNPYLTLVPAYLVPIALIYRSGTSTLNRVAMISFILLDPLLFSQFSLGYSDILWASLLSISIIMIERPVFSGLFAGLSFSLKQVPVLALPFIVILIFKKYGARKVLFFLLSLVAIFGAVNGYFLLISPGTYIRDVLSPETSSLIGIGFGPSQLSFLGYFYLSRNFFTFMMIFLVSFFTIIYFQYFDRIPYGFLAFPILIFLFNYRTVSEYLMYWPIIAMLCLPYISRAETQEHSVKKRNTQVWSKPAITKVAAIMLVLISVSSIGMVLFHSDYPINISSITPNYSSGKLQNITVNFSYSGSNTLEEALYFRITGEHPMVSQNGFIWVTTHNVSLLHGHEYDLEIVPQAISDEINITGSFRVTAYSVHTLGSYSGLLVINPT